MSNRLYVGNLPFSLDRDSLRELFAAHGTVTDVHVASDRETGKSRGFGFVSFASADEANAAVAALNGHSVDGRALVVNVARERGSGPPAAGGRPSGGRGSFGSSQRFSTPRPAPASAPGFDGPTGPPPEEDEMRRVRHRSTKGKKKPVREKERAPKPKMADEDESRGGGNWKKWLDEVDED